jgi:eukaryotic-like serine/threonine-protein kinase
MLRSVPVPRDAPTVVAVRPPGRAGARPARGDAEHGAEGALDAPAHSGEIEIGSPLRAGAMVAGRYQLVALLGRGGMGEVWSARHVTLHTEVAVKFPSLAVSGRAATAALTRFRFEAQVAARLGLLTRHVVAVHDAGCDPAGPYLVMEYVRGPTLQQELDEHVALPVARVAAVLAQVAEALAAAHGLGVVHRDLKPSNLLLTTEADGALLTKVADFGIAKALKADLGADLPADTTGGFMLGSPPYMSPEQMAGASASAQSDLWSLAVIAYEAITGRLPFAGRSFAELLASLAAGRFDRPSLVRPGVPRGVDAWCQRALCRDEARRFRSAAEMAEALREAVAEESAPVSARWAARAALHLRLVTGLFAPRTSPVSEPRIVEEQARHRDLG